MQIVTYRKPILGFAAYSGAGKTTLLERLIPELRQRDRRVSLIKHAHHDFDIDFPGKDSYRLRKAGAIETLVASGHRWALIHENPQPQTDPDLETLLQRLDTGLIDIVLVEGFKHQPFPRIELNRTELGKPFLYPDDSNIIAVATDQPRPLPPHLTSLDINNIAQIADFIERFIDIKRKRESKQ